MALIRWEPSEGLASLRHEMDRLLEDFWKRPGREGSTGEMEPAIEVSDSKKTVMVKVQVPGVSKDCIQVSVADNVLTVKGDMKEEEEKEEKNYHRREIRYGSFVRTITLPTAVIADKASATLKDGVLEVEIPKSEESKAKEIPIQT
jgi:HSP20 family protein